MTTPNSWAFNMITPNYLSNYLKLFSGVLHPSAIPARCTSENYSCSYTYYELVVCQSGKIIFGILRSTHLRLLPAPVGVAIHTMLSHGWRYGHALPCCSVIMNVCPATPPRTRYNSCSRYRAVVTLTCTYSCKK